MYISSIFAASAIVGIASSTSLMSRATSGEATFYGGNTDGGTCSFTGYTIPSGLYGLALTDSSWDNSKACGACISVTGPKGNKITAMVVDQCPGCGAGHLDLFPDAFAKLDDPSKGIIDVTWDYVDCPITSPLQVRNKEGTSAYWFSMQVINANKRVESLQFSTDGGSSWVSTQRQFYNYFEYSSGSGTTSVDVKVTSVDGDVVILKGVSITPGKITPAAGNFGGASVAQIPEPQSSTAAAVVVPSTTTQNSVTTTTQAAVFQEVPSNIINYEPTTFATSTSSKQAAEPAPIPSPTPYTVLTETDEYEIRVVTVTVNACPA